MIYGFCMPCELPVPRRLHRRPGLGGSEEHSLCSARAPGDPKCLDGPENQFLGMPWVCRGTKICRRKISGRRPIGAPPPHRSPRVALEGLCRGACRAYIYIYIYKYIYIYTYKTTLRVIRRLGSGGISVSQHRPAHRPRTELVLGSFL